MIRTLLLAVTITISSVTYACSCFGPRTFCSTLDPDPVQFPDPDWWIPSDVILAVKLGDYEYAADMKVVQVFSGTLQVDDEIRVWGDCGLLCRHYVNGFVGDTVLWAVQPTNFMGNGLCMSNFEEEGDYQLSICGIYLLGYDNGVVSGPLTQENVVQTATLQQFQLLVDNCALTTTVQPAPQPKPFRVAYAGGVPVIELAPGTARLEVLDQLGRVVLDRGNNGSPVRLEGLGHGVYVVRITREGTSWVEKVLMH